MTGLTTISKLIPPPKPNGSPKSESDSYSNDFDSVFGNPERDPSSALYVGPKLDDTSDTNLDARTIEANPDAAAAAKVADPIVAAKDSVSADATAAKDAVAADDVNVSGGVDVVAEAIAAGDKAAPAAPVAEAKPAVEVPAVAEAVVPAVTPTAKTYAPDQQFEFAEGVVATRADVLKMANDFGTLQAEVETKYRPLEQRATMLENAATTYYDTFQMDAATAAKQWGPLVKEIQSDPEFGQYLEEAIGYFRTVVRGENPLPKAAAAPAPAALPPEVQKRMEYTNSRVAEIDRREAIETLNAQVATATAQYPQLANPALQRTIAQLAYNGNQASGGRYSYVDAVRDNAELIRGYAVAAVAQAIPTPPAPPAQEVPALNGSGGASPNGARRPAPQYDGESDSVDDWIKNRAAYGYAS